MASSATAVATKRRLPAWMASFGVQVTLGLVFGVILGIVALSLGPQANGELNNLTLVMQKIGNLYVEMLKVVVIPLIITAIISSIANLRHVANAARLATQTLIWFAITSFIAVTIGIALGLILEPGLHVGAGLVASTETVTQGSWWDFLHGIVPKNFLGLEIKGDQLGFNVLQVIVVAAVLGSAALKVGDKADPFLAFNASMLAVIQKVLWWVIRLTPIGTMGLIAYAIAAYGSPTLVLLAWFIVAVYIGLAIVLLVVYPVLLRLHGLSVKQYFSGVWPAIQLGFVSRSSIGTLPLTQQVTEYNLGVPRAYASFAVPLGATTKMDGCAAIYPALAAIFVAQFYQIDLSVLQYILIVVVSVFGSAATAGMTGAVVMLTLTLATLGLPLEGVGLLLAIDPILDMARTAVNVAGQALVPTIVAKREGILETERYNAERQGLPFASDL